MSQYLTNYDMSNKMILDMTSDFSTETKRQQALRLSKKWAKTRLLEGLEGEKKENLAFILDNEARHLRGKLLSESVSTSDISGFNKIAFPLVRRVFAQLLTNNIVSVQPMSQASGLVFFLDFTWDKTRAGQIAGRSIYGNRATPLNGKTGGIGAQLGTGGFYGYQGLGYAHREFKIGVTPAATGASATGVVGATATSIHVTGTLSAFDFQITSGVDLIARLQMHVALSGEINYDASSASAFRGFTGIGSLTADSLAANIDRTLTQVTSTTNVRVYSNTSLTAASLTGISMPVLIGRLDTAVDGNGGTTLQTGDFESTTEIPQINLKVLSTFVSAQTKKLKTVWTPEVSQDLSMYMAIDPEVELTNILSEQIATEIDREILGDLISVAAVKGAWSRKIGRYVYVNSDGFIVNNDSTNVTFSGQSFFNGQKEWNNTLGMVISSVSSKIYKLNLRKGANWIVTGMQVSSVIETMGDDFSPADSAIEDTSFSFGIEKVGTMSKKYTIYRDPYFPEDLMLLGYKGTNPMETGYVWAPYIPLIVTPTIFSPDTFNPTKGVMTRNGKTTIRPDFYGTIRVTDLTWVGVV